MCADMTSRYGQMPTRNVVAETRKSSGGEGGKRGNMHVTRVDFPLLLVIRHGAVMEDMRLVLAQSACNGHA